MLSALDRRSTRKLSNGKTGDPADVGYNAMEGHEAHHGAEQLLADLGAALHHGREDLRRVQQGGRDRRDRSRPWTITRRFKTGRGVYNLAVTPDGKLLVATLKQGAKFEIFDLATGTSVAQIATSNAVAHGVAVSPDSRYAFVTSEGVGAQLGKVDIFDLVARQKVGTIDVGQQPGGIAFWRMEPVKR